MSTLRVDNITSYITSAITIDVDLNITGNISALNFSGTSGGGGVTEVTYLELLSLVTGGTLTTGSYYLITDFQTCYDQPDYDYNRNPIITSGNSKTAEIAPIIVFAISSSTLDENAYQPSYPNDKIKYDITFAATERTGSPAKGRITERIDEFNNRTDYDHRTILFKRYRYYEINFSNPYQGTVEVSVVSSTEMVVSGTGTNFLSISLGTEVGFDTNNNEYRVYRVTNVVSDTEMTITGLTNITLSFGTKMYSADWDEYSSYYQNNVDDPTLLFEEYYTFNGDNDYNNYIGNHANLYQWNENDFILANNVFHTRFISNKFGDGCFNNTFFDDCYNNTVGNDFYNNITDDDFDGNVIGNYFYNNRITSNFQYNRIGENFYNNYIVQNSFYRNNIMNDFRYNEISGGDFQNNEIGNQFNQNKIKEQFYKNDIGNGFNLNNIYWGAYGNLIGNGFYQNDIYCEFYDNTIGEYYGGNTLGDINNLGNFNFYRNRIGNNFNNNTIRQDFQNNQIGNQFNNNFANGNFYKNVIGNGFSYNQNIGYDFYGNHIGNEFNDNELIGDYFYNNTIGEYFESNSISYLFNNNQIGNRFENNTLGDTQYFNWDNTSIENLTGRTYGTFYDSLYGDDGVNNLGNIILGKELIMNFSRNSGTTITGGNLVIGETYEITNVAFVGGDFSNVADVIDGIINEVGCVFIATGTTPTSWCGITVTELTVYNEYHKVKFTQWTQNNNGGGFSYERTKVYPTSEPTVYFTKINYGSEIDVIVPGRLEIRRGNNGAIYNEVTENSWNQNVSPEGTEWNSIYTQPFNGSSFEANKISNEFKGNYIRGEFQGNTIDSYVGGNQFSGDTYANNIGSYTFDNDFLGQVGGNDWRGDFYLNTIGDNFNRNSFYYQIYDNTIGNDFYNNNIQSYFNNNTIGDGFQTNQIGNYFNNNTIGEGFGYGAAAPQGNIIGNNFYNNTVGEYFYNNTIADNFRDNEIGNYFQWNVINTNIDYTDFTINYGNLTGFSYTAAGTGATDTVYTDLFVTTNGVGTGATFDVEVSSGTVIGVTGATEGRFYQNGDVLTILGTQIGGVTGVIDGFSSDAVGKSGTTGSYTNIFATGTGGGENASFDVAVIDGLVDSIVLNNGGGGYSESETLTIVGSAFGGVDGVDDITITISTLYSDDVVITVTGITPTSLFYEHYTKQIFERKGGNKRVSFYDEDDILNVDSIYTASGYIPVYSQSLTFPINYASFNFHCDGVFSNNGGTTSQTVNNTQELVTLFNNIFRASGYFFDNNDGTIGLYINPSLKEQYCPSGTYSIYVFND